MDRWLKEDRWMNGWIDGWMGCREGEVEGRIILFLEDGQIECFFPYESQTWSSEVAWLINATWIPPP